MTKHPDIFSALAAEFDPREVKSRSGAGGRQLSYITARTAMNRLDSVVGPENWRNRHRLEKLSGDVDAVVCTIEIKIDGEWVPKEDAGGFKLMEERNRQGETVEDEENTVKTAYSDAFKRTAILWGIARYLYRDGSPDFYPGEVREHHAPAAPLSNQPASRPEARPSQARPDQTQQERPRPAPERKPYTGEDRPPTSGRALFAWIRKQDDADPSLMLLKHINGWAKRNELGGKMVDWHNDDIPGAVEEANRHIDTVRSNASEAYEDALSN